MDLDYLAVIINICGIKMNNEPVAWIDPNDNMNDPFSWNKTSCHTIPLYTHPAKTLTDEEIIDIIKRLTAEWKDDFKNYKYNSDEPEENKLRDDVFALLKKASER